MFNQQVCGLGCSKSLDACLPVAAQQQSVVAVGMPALLRQEHMCMVCVWYNSKALARVYVVYDAALLL
jgi:hypothetical protein